MHTRARGDQAEQIVIDWLHEKEFVLLSHNWTMRGGELDIVGYFPEEKPELVVIEVKSVSSMDDLMNYITPKKLAHLQRSLAQWIHDHAWKGTVRLDVVFVKDFNIIERFQNVTNT